MGFFGKQNNADGKYPDYGAIFMSNSGTKRECFERGLFALPSSAIQFVEQVKAGMILFLFENEKRQLHGVFQAASDGAVNIVPNAFSSMRQQFPAQVKFVQIWHCKPLSESVFRDAIRENYFSANKFNFGLSEKQVGRLLKLFSMRKLELDVPGRQSTRMKDLKSESYLVGKTGRSVDHGMHVESVKDEQGVGANISPITRHRRQGDSVQFYGEYENIGFNASVGVASKQGRAAEFAMDTASGYAGDYLAFQDEFGYATREKEQYMDVHLRPAISGGYPRSPSDKIRVHSDGVFPTSHRLMSEDLRKTGQRMIFSDDDPGLHHSNVNPSVFSSKPILEHSSLVQDLLRPSSAMIQPIQEQILNNSCSTRGNAGSKSTLLYDPDHPGLNFSQSSSVRINYGSNSMLESTSLPNNCGRNSFGNQTCLMPTEVNDMNRCHDVGYDLLNNVSYDSYRDYMPSNVAQNADQLAAKSVAYNSISSLNSSSALVPPSDIGNSDRVHDPFPYLLPNCKSYAGNEVHPMALRANLGHEMTLEKSNEYFPPGVPWANEGHSQVQYGDPLVNEYDTECHGDSQNSSGYPKKKSSVFSRLSFMQDTSKQKNGNNALNKGYHINSSVDEVMEMVCQSRNEWMQKRKPKPLVKRIKTESLRDKNKTTSSRINSDCVGNTLDDVKRNKTESLRDKTQTISSSSKSDCFGNTLDDVSMDLTAASDDNTGKTPEETCFVDFKRRSKVRKLNDENKIQSTSESERNENVVLVQQKRRKLIRPNFSVNPTSDDKGIDLGMPQNLQVPLSHGSSNSSYASERGYAMVQTKDNLTTDAEVKNFVGQTHSGDKRSRRARKFVCNEGLKARDGTLAAMNDGSEYPDNINNPNVSSSASCKDKSCHLHKGLYMMDSIKSVSLNMESTHSISREHHADMVLCANGGANTEGEVPTDGSSSTIEVKDGSYCLQKSSDENAPNETSCHINEVLPVMDGIKSASRDKESPHSTYQEDHVEKVICARRGIITEEEMSRDGGSSFTIEVKTRSECTPNSGNEKTPIETSSHVKEGSYVMDSTNPASPDTEALHSICHADKIVCAGRGIDTENEVSKDGGSSRTIVEVKNRSECVQKFGNEKVPIETFSHVKESSHVMDCTESVSPDTEALHSICPEHHTDKIMCAGSDRGIDAENEVSKDGGSSFTIEAKDGTG